MINKFEDPAISASNVDKDEEVIKFQRQEVLLKTCALQNAILNSAIFSSIATDEHGVIQIFNIGAERMLGYSAAEVLHKITPEDFSDTQEVIALAQALSLEFSTIIQPGFAALAYKAKRGKEDFYELTYICKNSARLPAVVSVSALLDPQSCIIGYLFISIDNAQRKQVEVRQQQLLKIQEETNKQLLLTNLNLQASEAKLAVTLNSIGDGVIATDAEARMTLMNPVAEQLTGWTSEQALGKPVDEIFHIISQETRLTSAVPILETLAHGTIQGLANHTILIARDGGEHSIADSCAPIRDNDGLIAGAVLVFRDVTKEYAVQKSLRIAQEKLHGTEQSFRLMVESVTDYSIVMLDPAGLVVSWNNGAQRIKGYTAEEIIGQHFSLFYTQEDINKGSPQRNLNIAADSGHYEEEGWRLRKDGSHFWANEVFTAMKDHDNKLHGFARLTRDLTERKRQDKLFQDKNAELEKSKSAAEKANRAKSDFLSSMSHELRTPLNAILGFAQLLEAGFPQPTASQLSRLQQIIKAGWYLLDLINEILDLALIESGKLPLSREPVLLIDVIQECQAMIEPQAQKRDIDINFHNFDTNWVVYADRTRLKQVLINLLSNAIKYNCLQGSVEVVCTDSLPDFIRISITDNGAGLAPEKLTQLFQPFNRLGQETGAEEGTGIGLVVTKQLVEMMGGRIGVKSTVGVGSEFWVELIRDFNSHSVEVNTKLVENARNHANQSLHTLLYVEDNPANLMLVEELIADQHHVKLLSARDGLHGVELARSHLPDMILMDINLPGINGMEALKILQDDPTTKHIPIVALSANAMPLDIEKGLKAGFFRYLTKPIKINEFISALDDALVFSERKPDKKHD